MAVSTIITGQFVRISQVPASIGERFIARLIDYFILFIYVAVTAYLLYLVNTFLFSASNFSIIVVVFVIYLPALTYSLLWEVFNNGQSPGKYILNIRVVKCDGTMPTFGSYLLRWLLYNIDVTFTAGLGIIPVILTKNNQRLGDLAAGTMVIKEHNYKKIQVNLDEFKHLSEDYRPVFPQAAELSLEQLNIITRTLELKKKNGRDIRIKQLANKIRQLFIIKPSEMDDEMFLQTIIRDYQYYALEMI